MNELSTVKDLSFRLIRPEHEKLFINNVVTVYEDLSPSIVSYESSVPILTNFIMHGKYYYLIFAGVNLDLFKEVTNGLQGEELDQAISGNIKDFIIPVEPDTERDYILDTKSVLDHYNMFYAEEPERRQFVLINKPIVEVW